MAGSSNSAGAKKQASATETLIQDLGVVGGKSVEDIPHDLLKKGPARHKYFQLERVFWLAMVAFHCFFYWGLVFGWGREHKQHLYKVAKFQKPWKIFEYFGSIGRDVSDVQLSDIIKNLWLLGSVMVGFVVLSQLARRSFGSGGQSLFRLVFGLGLMWYAHGGQFVVPLVLITANYFIIQLYRFVPGKVLIPAIWVLQIALLFVLDTIKTNASSSHSMARFVRSYLSWLPAAVVNHNEVIRWSTVFNLHTLRMLSFNYDYYEAATKGAKSREVAVQRYRTSVECAMQKGPSYKLRSDYPHYVEKYTFFNYLTYMVYAPLYIAGPMSSFNAFVSYSDRPATYLTRKDLARYAFTVLRLYVALEVFIHMIPFNAIREEMARGGLKHSFFLTQVVDIGTLGCFFAVGLGFLWLKFSFVWKFFRLFALLDGIDVPEDMNKCFSATVTCEDFWRNWHASFNVWIVRYMYIPMGGNKTKAVSIWIIFGFIAIWHDVELHLLTWAFVMCSTLIFEAAVKGFITSKKIVNPSKRRWRTIGACASTMLLVAANCIGFGGAGSSSGDGGNGLADIPVGYWWLMPLINTPGPVFGVIMAQEIEYRNQVLKNHFFGGNKE